MKKNLIILLTILLLSVFSFYVFTVESKDNSLNGFNRSFKDVHLNLINAVKLPHTAYGFLSKPKDSIWLTNYKHWLEITKFSRSLDKQDTVKINVPKEFDSKVRSMDLGRIGSTIFITNKRNDISRVNMNHAQNFKLPKPQINDIRALTPNSFLTKIYNQNKNGNFTSLNKLSLGTQSNETAHFIVPKFGDGIFDCDGKIYYDKGSSKVFYLYYYRGEFLCLDTNLNLLYKAKTIDTLKRPKMDVVSIDIKNEKQGIYNIKRSLSGIPKYVNYYMSINDDLLYVLPALKADNETGPMEDAQQSVDVYEINDGKYLYSFHLPLYQGHKPKQIEVSKNRLTALYRNFLVVYEFGIK